MIFNYQATSREGVRQDGAIEAPTEDLAIASLQRRGLIILNIKESGGTKWWNLNRKIKLFSRVKTSDVVILSRQIATLFEAKVSVLSTFRLLASESSNPILQEALTGITDDVKGGIAISAAMAKHPDVFSTFYVSMVKAGEESGKLSETFTFLADHLERSYELVSRAKNALIYPAFVVASFIVVMVLMLIFVIPRLSAILLESGQDVPIYTKIVIGASNFLAAYWPFLLLFILVIAFFLWRYIPTQAGKASWSRFQLEVPYVSNLYKKLYLSRIADNLNTMLTSGVAMVRALEVTAEVVGNQVYRNILLTSAEAIKSGSSVSDAFARYPEIPGIMIQMIKVGEESGKLGFVLSTVARFYQREVNNEVDTLVGLIEPVMIVVLGLGVGLLLTSVLVPIYNVASSL